MSRLFESRWFFALMTLLLVGVAVASLVEVRTAGRPSGEVGDLASLRARDDVNVLFILIDTLRADHLPCYGYQRPTAPVLCEMAAHGVRFAHVQSQSSWTKPSMASMWLGSYPERTGVQRFYDGIPEAAKLPAEILKEAGFVTASIYRNGWVAPNFGFAQGFDLYFRPQPSQRAERVQRRSISEHRLQGHDLDITENAIEFLRTQGRERFLLYLHYMDVHQYVYDETSGLFGTRYVDAYDNAIHWTDRNIALLINALQEQDLFGETLIVVASDHGEAFYEHGSEGHAKNLYREVTETPLLLSLPFNLEPGVVVPDLVRNIDIWPTILDLLGLPAIEGAQGRSLVPLIEAAAQGAEPNGAQTAIAQLDRHWARGDEEPFPVASIVKGPYRLLYNRHDDNRLELYDRDQDPMEHKNIAAEQVEIARELREEAETVLSGAEAPWGKPDKVEIDEMRKAQLRALGYIVQ